MSEVSFVNVNKHYGDLQVIFDVSLTVNDGEFVVFVGPSGCGKSTLLRAIAGLEDITDGELRIGGRAVNDVPPSDREVAMVFQSYALYPHMSVKSNMDFGLKVNKVPQLEREKRIEEAAKILQLEDYLDRKPAQLSGGQRQRVAIGRAIVKQPRVFLFDEPLSNLDAALRVQMRVELDNLHKTLGTTMIYVTHDQVEAMTMGDRVAVFDAGCLQQVDTPQRLFERPVNTFVAGFIGSPSMNLIDSRIEPTDDGLAMTLAGERIALGRALEERFVDASTSVHRVTQIGLRPEDVVDPHLAGEERCLHGQVVLTELLGREQMVYLDLRDGTRAVARLHADHRLQTGEEIAIGVDPERLYLFQEDGRALTYR